MEFALRGMITAVLEMGMNAASPNLTQGRAQLDALLRGKETIGQNLNYILGQPLDQDTVIEVENELPELPKNLSDYIEAMVNQTHQVRFVQLELDRALNARWVYSDNYLNLIITKSDRRRVFNENRTRGLWRTSPHGRR